MGYVGEIWVSCIRVIQNYQDEILMFAYFDNATASFNWIIQCGHNNTTTHGLKLKLKPELTCGFNHSSDKKGDKIASNLSGYRCTAFAFSKREQPFQRKPKDIVTMKTYN